MTSLVSCVIYSRDPVSEVPRGTLRFMRPVMLRFMRPVCALMPVPEARHGGLAVLLPGSGGSFTRTMEVIHNLTHCASCLVMLMDVSRK